ncbi:hypothetical protein [Mesonia aquimarina]|uniref:hypothetical protein n=1 Tax=Mesonia aquimarina TaxID=1504967 RepID=UPI0013CF1581|nr:hypothetical protein [Mesonia aquimarina]
MSVKKGHDNTEEDYILQDNKKTRIGTGFIIVVLILLITAVVISGFYMQWW